MCHVGVINDSFMLIDILSGDVVIHLFLPPQRTFYNLEDFYGNAMQIELPFEDLSPPRNWWWHCLFQKAKKQKSSSFGRRSLLILFTRHDTRRLWVFILFVYAMLCCFTLLSAWGVNGFCWLRWSNNSPEISDMFLICLLDRVRPNCVQASCNVCFRMILHVVHTLTKTLANLVFTALRFLYLEYFSVDNQSKELLFMKSLNYTIWDGFCA